MKFVVCSYGKFQPGYWDEIVYMISKAYKHSVFESTVGSLLMFIFAVIDKTLIPLLPQIQTGPRKSQKKAGIM